MTLRSGSGTELAQGTFSKSWLSTGPTRIFGRPDDYRTYLCHLSFNVRQLPESSSYALYLASRRVNQLSLGAMKSAHWSIKLTVGDGTWSG